MADLLILLFWGNETTDFFLWCAPVLQKVISPRSFLNSDPLLTAWRISHGEMFLVMVGNFLIQGYSIICQALEHRSHIHKGIQPQHLMLISLCTAACFCGSQMKTIPVLEKKLILVITSSSSKVSAEDNFMSHFLLRCFER